ncbi:MAG: ATP-binding cassette domain-containing protein [Eubacterium sp.]|nr:ATP-binding cassette domain-containing protein [Eubacterium sp.]
MEACNFKNVSFTYPNRAEKALNGASFTVNKGEFCLVTGQSASGKSTLLKLLKKEIAPHGTLEGEITVNGTVGYVSQHYDESLVTDRVRSELEFSPVNAGMGGDEIELLVAETAAYFNLESKLDRDISALSGGEKQILSLASVMIMHPDILVLDEPSSQLDPFAAATFFDMVRTMRRDFGTTVIMATHALSAVWDMADDVLLLDSGKALIKADKEQVSAYLKNKDHPMQSALPGAVHTAADRTSETDEIALRAKGIYFAYDKGNDVLKGTDLKLYKNRINAIVGTNGSGKTTLFKVLCGVKKPYRGKVKSSAKVSMLPQNVQNLFTHDTCGEEVEFGKITDFLGISDIADCHPYDISGGQAQRLALAKVLATGADILLLDEPTKGVDCVIKTQLGALLKRLCDEGKTVAVVTHDLDFAAEYADYASFLSQGRIVATMPKSQFFSKLRFYR